jgi:hypothetical protein
MNLWQCVIISKPYQILSIIANTRALLAANHFTASGNAISDEMTVCIALQAAKHVQLIGHRIR